MASNPDRGEILLTELQGDSRTLPFSENVSAVQKLDFSDTMVQQKLDDIKDRIKREIRKELKIKEGAENLRKVTTDKKNLAYVDNILKKSNKKIRRITSQATRIKCTHRCIGSRGLHRLSEDSRYSK